VDRSDRERHPTERESGDRRPSSLHDVIAVAAPDRLAAAVAPSQAKTLGLRGGARAWPRGHVAPRRVQAVAKARLADEAPRRAPVSGLEHRPATNGVTSEDIAGTAAQPASARGLGARGAGVEAGGRGVQRAPRATGSSDRAARERAVSRVHALAHEGDDGRTPHHDLQSWSGSGRGARAAAPDAQRAVHERPSAARGCADRGRVHVHGSPSSSNSSGSCRRARGAGELDLAFPPRCAGSGGARRGSGRRGLPGGPRRPADQGPPTIAWSMSAREEVVAVVADHPEQPSRSRAGRRRSARRGRTEPGSPRRPGSTSPRSARDGLLEELHALDRRAARLARACAWGSSRGRDADDRALGRKRAARSRPGGRSGGSRPPALGLRSIPARGTDPGLPSISRLNSERVFSGSRSNILRARARR